MMIGGAQTRGEMVFEGLNCTLSGVDTVFVGWKELPFDIVIAEVFGDCSGGFIIKDIELWFETFAFKV